MMKHDQKVLLLISCSRIVWLWLYSLPSRIVKAIRIASPVVMKALVSFQETCSHSAKIKFDCMFRTIGIESASVIVNENDYEVHDWLAAGAEVNKEIKLGQLGKKLLDWVRGLYRMELETSPWRILVL